MGLLGFRCVPAMGLDGAGRLLQEYEAFPQRLKPILFLRFLWVG